MAKNNQCEVCGAECHVLAYCCKRCKKLLDRIDIRKKPDRQARLRALKQSWDGAVFRCHYTSVPLEVKDHGDPRYLTFDHLTPRKESCVVVCAALVNDMKTDMTDKEFRYMVQQLAEFFAGGKFNPKAFNVSCWKRKNG